jgi:ribosome-binding factor A
MPQGSRTDRIGEEFREILAEEILRLKDPRVGFVTVTGVKVSHDLRVAWVYFSVFGDEKAKAGTRAALRSAVAYLRHELARQVRLKTVPELRFEEDPSIATGERIDRIIDELHQREGAGDA